MAVLLGVLWLIIWFLWANRHDKLSRFARENIKFVEKGTKIEDGWVDYTDEYLRQKEIALRKRVMK